MMLLHFLLDVLIEQLLIKRQETSGGRESYGYRNKDIGYEIQRKVHGKIMCGHSVYAFD